jgi:hypothetical protein
LSTDAEQLEQIYHSALKAGQEEAFREAIDASYGKAPDNLLYAAWYHRLKHAAIQVKGHVIAWAWAMPLAVLNGLLFWWLSRDEFAIATHGFRGRERDYMPLILVLAASVAAVFVLAYLSGAGRRRWLQSGVVAIALLGAAAYALLVYPQTGPIPYQEQYLTLMTMHLPLLAWAGVGVLLVSGHRDSANRLSFLFKTLEAVIVGGLCLAALGLFTAITFGLFEALAVAVPEMVQRLFIAGGIGLITVVAPAVVYDATLPPVQQAFDQGIGKLLPSLMRALIPLTLLVLIVYLFFIPFNFWAPFHNRNVLTVYNGMLFAVIALLVGATRVNSAGIGPRMERWLRWGINGVAVLTLVISLYALAAVLYRTAIDRLTPNRLTIIGWNVVNLALLALVLVQQFRSAPGRWLEGHHRAFGVGTILYPAWALVVLLAIPWLFGINQRDLDALPASVQEIVYDHPSPVLLKCAVSPHIYLLERGEKRWIDSIETFNRRGYTWGYVHFLSCEDLRTIPDGVTIPADAGPPPQP